MGHSRDWQDQLKKTDYHTRSTNRYYETVGLAVSIVALVDNCSTAVYFYTSHLSSIIFRVLILNSWQFVLLLHAEL